MRAESVVTVASCNRDVFAVGQGFIRAETLGVLGVVDGYSAIFDDDALTGQADNPFYKLLAVLLAEFTKATLSKDDDIAATWYIGVVCQFRPAAGHFPDNEFIGIFISFLIY